MQASASDWLIIVMSGILIIFGIFTVIRPNSAIFSAQPGGVFRNANNWQYMDNTSTERSPAGLVLMRFIGFVFIAVGIGLLITGIGRI